MLPYARLWFDVSLYAQKVFSMFSNSVKGVTFYLYICTCMALYMSIFPISIHTFGKSSEEIWPSNKETTKALAYD